MNTKLTTTLITSAALLMASSTLAFASGTSNCQVIYGGGEVCPPEVKFTIDKKVMSPTKGGQMVDNLSVNDPKFSAGNSVTFQLVVKNTGSKDVTLNVEDVLPSYLDYVSGGTYDAGNKKVTNSVTLKAGEEKTFTVVAKVTSNENLPANQSVVCVTNIARAKDNAGTVAEDNAQLCIEKGVAIQPKVPTKNIPDTGPEMLALAFLPPVGLAGFYLRRRAGL
jgi:uncharacterized repeat protein (TIGR01451 family)